MQFKAVLFDWRGTLAYTPPEQEWVRLALARLDRDEADAAAVWAQIAAAPNVQLLDAPGIDADAHRHRTDYHAVFAAAGIDHELATTLYELESDAALNPFATDAAEVLEAVHSRGALVAVVSDIHFDIRPAFVGAGTADCVDRFVLSFEQGTQKPAAAMFNAALELLGVEAADVLMVGDRSGHDGAAVDVGIVTLLLPPLASPEDRRLHRVLALLG